MIQTDFLVIGSGIAGLTYALKIAHYFTEKQVIIVTKGDESESNTKYAQGGIAVVFQEKNDSFDKHIEDTLIAGDGLCDEDVVRMVIEEGPARLKEMISWGAGFDKGSSGEYDLGKEGGHSMNRIFHHKDVTGLAVEMSLLDQIKRCKNITMLDYHYVIDLITGHHSKSKQSTEEVNCYGAYVLDQKSNRIKGILASTTMLTSGGIGQAYKNTTNPAIATGDGVALAYRAKAQIKDMEFVQFHPTALYEAEVEHSFLISEAVRGFGAILRTRDGEEFMSKYDDRKELASRDIVAQAIDTELKKSGDKYVYLDCTHLDMVEFEKHFPNITEKCKNIGIDVSTAMIPVVPAAHYLCGGVEVDSSGRTSISNLYAGGECARTGLHGANRLASNSLLEALVYAHRSFVDAQQNEGGTFDEIEIPKWNAEGTSDPKEKVLITHSIEELRVLMSDYVGIVRSDERLAIVKKRLKLLYLETEDLYERTTISPQLCELRNLITVAYLIVKQSRMRKENRGGFFNIDNV